MTMILRVDKLVKDYPGVRAVDDVSFCIESGSCFGLLGPNGAGKTTPLEIIEGIGRPTSGTVLYKGQPISRRFREEAGFLFQTTALQEFLTVRETLELFSKLYERTVPLQQIIETCALSELLQRDNRKLSGGQRQRLLLGIALINDPQIVFLDEPTTGMDPQARQNFWKLIDFIKQQRKTIVLTTHYMEEAQQLCDVIAIMDQGRIIAKDTPEQLLKDHFDDILLQIPQASFPFAVAEMQAHGIQEPYSVSAGMVDLHTRDVHKTILNLNRLDVDLSQLVVRNRNLEDLFLKLTGKELRA